MLRKNQTTLTHAEADHVSVLWEAWKEGKVSNILTLFCLFDPIFSLKSLCMSARNYDRRVSNSLFQPLASSPGLSPYPFLLNWSLFHLKQRKEKLGGPLSCYFFKLLRLNLVRSLFLFTYLLVFTHYLYRVYLL